MVALPYQNARTRTPAAPPAKRRRPEKPPGTDGSASALAPGRRNTLAKLEQALERAPIFPTDVAAFPGGFVLAGVPVVNGQNDVDRFGIWCWNGAELRQLELPERAFDVTALWASSERDIWVGFRVRPSTRRVFRWNGESWGELPSLAKKGEGLDHYINSISGRGPDDVWLAGRDSDSYDPKYGRVWHWDGSDVMAVEIPWKRPDSLHGPLVAGPAPGGSMRNVQSGAWAYWPGNGRQLFRIEGSVARAVELPPGPFADFLWVTPDDEPWLFGSGSRWMSSDGRLEHWNGSKMVEVSSGMHASLMSGAGRVVMAATKDGLFRREGDVWSPALRVHSCGNNSGILRELTIGTMQFESETSAWAVAATASAGRMLLHWDGASWLSVPRSRVAVITALSSPEPNVVFATRCNQLSGDDASGALMKVSAGGQEQILAELPQVPLAVMHAGVDEAWAAGEEGMVVHCTREKCLRHDVPELHDALIAIGRIGGGIYVGSRTGMIAVLARDGQWSVHGVPRDFQVSRYWVDADGRIWARRITDSSWGRAACAMKWSGEGWEYVRCPRRDAARFETVDVAGGPNGTFAIGAWEPDGDRSDSEYPREDRKLELLEADGDGWRTVSGPRTPIPPNRIGAGRATVGRNGTLWLDGSKLVRWDGEWTWFEPGSRCWSRAFEDAGDNSFWRACAGETPRRVRLVPASPQAPRLQPRRRAGCDHGHCD